MPEDEVHSMFAAFGNIVQCRLLRTPDGKSKGVAFILFELHDQVTTTTLLLCDKQMQRT